MDSFDNISFADDTNVKAVNNFVRSWLRGKKLTTFNIMELVTVVIPFIQKIVKDKHAGHYKKQLLLSVLHTIVAEKLQFGTDKEKSDLLLIIDETLPSTIDAIIAVSQGKIQLNKKTIGLLKKLLCKLLRPCLGGKASYVINVLDPDKRNVERVKGTNDNLAQLENVKAPEPTTKPTQALEPIPEDEQTPESTVLDMSNTELNIPKEVEISMQ